MPGSELTRRLFVPEERWGWEYVDPGMNLHPDHDRPPVWHEPPPPDIKKYEDELSSRIRKFPKILIIPTIILMLGWRYLVAGEISWVFIAVAWIGFLIFQIVRPRRKIIQEKSRWQVHRDAEWERYQSATAGWRATVESHEVAEQVRRAEVPLFHPLAPRSTASRIDVCGGTRDGWASLLATVGSSVLSSGGGILLLDFSERGIGGGVARLATAAGFPVTGDDLPADTGRLGLLRDIDPEDVAELLANAVDTLRPGSDNPAIRLFDAEILTTIATRLDPPLTFTRLASGLRVLQGRDQLDGPDALSSEERDAIASRLDTLGSSEQIQQAIYYLRACLERLAEGDEAAAVGTAPSWWPLSGLRVMETSSRDTSAARKELIDQVLFQIVLHRLRRRRDDVSRDMLVVAGGDRMGLPALESMARHAANAGIRLVNLFEHLAEGAERLIGTGDSATLIMQLGNAREAEAAAEFVGRGHKFVFSQITRQVGSSLTTGTSSSAGGSVTVSETEGRSGSRGKGGRSGGWNRSVSVSQSAFWEDTESLSVTDSQQDGAIMQRVYEFSVEPTQIQQLPPTAFVLVDSSLGERRAALGDCNPGIVLLPRVASTARPAVPSASRRPGVLPMIAGQSVPPGLTAGDAGDQPEAINLGLPWEPDNG